MTAMRRRIAIWAILPPGGVAAGYYLHRFYGAVQHGNYSATERLAIYFLTVSIALQVFCIIREVQRAVGRLRGQR